MTMHGNPAPPRRRAAPRKRLSRTAVLFGAIAAVLIGGGALGVAATGVLDSAGATPIALAKAHPSGQAGVSPPAPAPADSITLSAVGDVIQGAAPNGLPPNGGRDLFADVHASLASDLVMGNLEQPITEDTGHTKCSAASTSCFAFRVPPSYAQNLRNAGFQLMNQANNHGNDFGPAGYTNTRAALDTVGVKYTGAPGEITIVTVKGIKVAVLGFAPYAWAQSLTDLGSAAALVRKAKTMADLVVVQAHVGAEGPDKQHVTPGTEYFLGENRGDSYHFARTVIDAGADIVICHGPHVMRAMEFYKGKLIDYSLGNFVGYKALQSNGNSAITGILKVTLRKDGSFVTGQLIATQMVAPGVPRMDPDRRAIGFVGNLCKQDFGATGAVISPDGTIRPPNG